jgi:hypothetical protein
MGEQYCQYCHNHWKYKKEYEKHLACCAYFYHLRRNPKSEMDDYGCALPTQKEMFRFIQELSLKCERLEKEVGRLKNTVGIRQKKVITDCLNRPGQTPLVEFNEWWRKMTLQMPVEPTPAEGADMDAHWSLVNNVFLFRVFKQDLVEGIKHVLLKFVEGELSQGKLPVRCFVQKPGIFYIYCGGLWRHMTNADFETMIDYLSQLFVREFLAWQRDNSDCIDEDERRCEEQIRYMMRVNRMHPSKEKGMTEIRKWLFTKLEENASTTLEPEFV